MPICGTVSQISPPIRIVLVAVIGLLAAWMLFLRPKTEPVPAPNPAPATAPGVTGLSNAVDGAKDAAAAQEKRDVAANKAMDEDTLLCFRMNGEPIPAINGAPLRMITPGWPGSLSQKWLTRIQIRDKVHDGAGMGGTSYRLPVRPMVPGATDDGAFFAEMESMPVRSILSSHAHGTRLPAGARSLDLRGAAWAGLAHDLAVGEAPPDESGCDTWAGGGAVAGAIVGAGGVAVVSVLVLRAMAEWRRELELEGDA